MQRACFVMRIKKDEVEEYRAAHEPVWPEMLDAMRRAGIRTYSMFLRSDGLLVGYLEAEDVQRALAEVGATDVSRRWEERMAPYFEGGSGDLRCANVEWLDEFFHAP